MTPEQQIKALAELDGLEWMRDPADNCWCWFNKLTRWFCGKNLFPSDNDTNWEALPNYRTSYDAIIPLIQKQTDSDGRKSGFILYLTGNTVALNFYGVCDLLRKSPAQLCEALLRATGKWIE